MDNAATIPAGSIIYESLLYPFVRFRRFLWDAGFFIISTYLLMIGLASTAMLAGALGIRIEAWSTVIIIAAYTAYGSIAIDFLIRWHRTVQSDGAEPRPSFLPRFERTHLRYFLCLLGICAVAVLVLILMGLVVYAILAGMDLSNVDRTAAGYQMLTSLIRMGLTALLIAILGRFLLMLPIVAIGREEPFDSASKLYSDHWLPVSIALSGVSLIIMLCQFAFAAPLLAVDGSTNQILAFLGLQLSLVPLVIVLGIGIFASALTMTYRQLIALRREAPAAAG